MIDLHLIIRYFHVTAMALMLGGALLLWWLAARAPNTVVDTHEQLLLFVAQRYELLFWLALGVIIMTGVGNLGAFGAALPGPATVWGMKFVAKIVLVLVLILISLVRTLCVARSGTSGPHRTMLRNVYGGTALFVLAILFLAVSLAHGG